MNKLLILVIILASCGDLNEGPSTEDTELKPNRLELALEQVGGIVCINGVKSVVRKDYLHGHPKEDYVVQKILCTYYLDSIEEDTYDYLRGSPLKDRLIKRVVAYIGATSIEVKVFDYDGSFCVDGRNEVEPFIGCQKQSINIEY